MTKGEKVHIGRLSQFLVDSQICNAEQKEDISLFKVTKITDKM